MVIHFLFQLRFQLKHLIQKRFHFCKLLKDLMHLLHLLLLLHLHQPQLRQFQVLFQNLIFQYQHLSLLHLFQLFHRLQIHHLLLNYLRLQLLHLRFLQRLYQHFRHLQLLRLLLNYHRCFRFRQFLLLLQHLQQVHLLQ